MVKNSPNGVQFSFVSLTPSSKLKIHNAIELVLKKIELLFQVLSREIVMLWNKKIK